MMPGWSSLENQGQTIRSESLDRKSTRLNSSHSQISYAVFCLKKKNTRSRCHRQLLRLATHPGELGKRLRIPSMFSPDAVIHVCPSLCQALRRTRPDMIYRCCYGHK